MTYFSMARENMVESQVRPSGITDRRILDAMAQIPREAFVPPSRRDVAYVDEDVMLVPQEDDRPARYLIEAMAFARLVQLAEIRPTDRILHVGAGTGYGTAVLARLGATVVAVESDERLLGALRSNLAGLTNVSIVEGPLTEGAKSAAPFDVILFEGRIGELPSNLLTQVSKDDGRIVAVVGDNDMAKANLWVITSGTAACRKAFDASVAKLPGLGKNQPAFVF